ncbi:Fanconi anemia group I protein [Aphis craccivora]|uniref:Fanconi anemia group I protein n=1 Tax=Aphis craccivora TaxID=307492 RepID=A0A6G0Z5S4_APHCR|nr:Fanconi anemia group I protein [Aphis craccivora]
MVAKPMENFLLNFQLLARAVMCLTLCGSLCEELHYVKHFLFHIKDEQKAIKKKNTIYLDQMKSREKAICHRMAIIVCSASSLIKTNIPVRKCTEDQNLLNSIKLTATCDFRHNLQKPQDIQINNKIIQL